MFRPALLALGGLALLAGCADDSAPTDAAAVAAGPSPDASNPSVVTDSIPATSLRTDSSSTDYEAPVTLVSMTEGDTACYLAVSTGSGAERTEYADFRLCERDDLIGQRVLLTPTPSPVQSPSCGGDPECTDTEMVNMITGIDPASTAPTRNVDLDPLPPDVTE